MICGNYMELNMNKFEKTILNEFFKAQDLYIKKGYPLQPITKYIREPMRWFFHQSSLLRHDSKFYVRPYLLNLFHSMLVVNHPEEFYIYNKKIKFRSYGSLMSAQAYYVGEVEYHLIQYLLSQIKPNFMMIDVGAHHGVYTLVAAYELKNRRWKGLIHSFEPDPGNYSLLKYNIEQNGLEDYVKLYNKAVSDKPGWQSFALNLKENSHNFIYLDTTKKSDNFEKNSSYDYISVEVVKIDDFINELNYVDLIKIDIQGGEPFALLGAKSVIEVSKPIILVEAVQQWETTNLTKEILQRYNYSILSVDRNGQLCDLNSKKTFVSWDWVGMSDDS